MTSPKTKIDVSLETTRQMAVRRARGASLRDLEAEFGYSRPVVNRVLATDVSKAIISEITESSVKAALLEVRNGLAAMSDLAIKALKKNLEDGSIEAVKTYFRALGLETTEKTNGNQQQAIQVILPGAVAPPKDVINEPGV